MCICYSSLYDLHELNVRVSRLCSLKYFRAFCVMLLCYASTFFHYKNNDYCGKSLWCKKKKNFGKYFQGGNVTAGGGRG